jgi:ribonuclease-3
MGNSESQILLDEIQTKGGHRFTNEEVLKEALTHDSCRVNDPSIPTYQRLEFLGDSVLQLVISEYLYKQFPTYTPGQLTSQRQYYVCNDKLRKIANRIGVSKYISLADGVRNPRATTYKGYGNFIEAFIGAVYMDCGGGPEGLKAATNSVYILWGLQAPNEDTCAIV